MNSTKPLPLRTQPAPKPGAGTREPLSQAEWANIGRQWYSAITLQQQGYRLIDQAKQRQNQLIADVNSRLGNEGLGAEVCSLCGLAHVGEC